LKNTTPSIIRQLSLDINLGEEFLGSALDDTSSDRQASALLKEQIHFTGSLTALIDTPNTQ
jgi:hypothetical protein